MKTFSMLSRLLKRVHTLIFGFLLIYSDLFSIFIVLYCIKIFNTWCELHGTIHQLNNNMVDDYNSINFLIKIVEFSCKKLSAILHV
jgi:glucan phosphoethanolaminetransferase (alkaline phosphatase superfamily)